MRRVDHTRLVITVVLAVLASFQIQELAGNPVPCPTEMIPPPGCECNQYLDGSCRNCSDCEALGQVTVDPCTKVRDAVCSECIKNQQFFNDETLRCQNCTECAVDERIVVDCTIEEDRQCQPRCQPHQYYDAVLNRCLFACEKCQYGCLDSGTPRCRCNPADCYSETDLLCVNNMCTPSTAPPTEATKSATPGSDPLPTWGIGLISIGVVIGIVAFSAGSMILSFCTRKTTPIAEDAEPPSDSKSVLVGRERYPLPIGHHSPFIHHHSALEKYRYSPNAPRTNSNASSIGSSKRGGSFSGGGRTNSHRSSPKALRLAQVPRTENATPI